MSSAKHNGESTFTPYTAEQARAYAAGRSSYSPRLFETIYTHHANSGGSFTRVLDVACGPGNATRDLALAFDETVGTDRSIEMANMARAQGGVTRTGKPIVYTVASVEDIWLFEEESVDLVTVAMAVHWFNMDKFWPNIARVLKPCGTVALWNVCSLYCHPSTPNASAVQAALFKLEHEKLNEYKVHGNLLADDGYRSLPLPWNINSPEPSFQKSSFTRLEWNKDGQLKSNEEYFSGQKEMSFGELEQALGTASTVIRWREANPTLVNTSKDCVREAIAEIKSLLPAGTKRLIVGGSTVLLMLKKVPVS